MHASEAYEQQIYSDKLRTLYSSNLISTVATLLVGFVYFAVQLPNHSSISLLLWYLTLIGIYTFRLFLTKRYFTVSPPFDKQFQWLRRFRTVVFMTGLTLGSTIILFYPADDISHKVFTVFLLAGMAAGGLTVLVADLLCFTLYVCSLLLPPIIVCLSAGDSYNFCVAVLLSTFLFIMLRASKSLNHIVTSSLKLRYENLLLVDRLEQEKNQLNNRLGRILNDSSNELYITSANTFECLQVNKGALENLGFTQDEISDMTLLDISADLDKKKIDKLLEPLRKGDKESITHKTFQKRKDGSLYPAELRFQLSTQEDPPVMVVTALDITERDEAERKLIHQANFDQLTNLPNRYYMLSYINSALARARRQLLKVSLLFLDLNNFKDINDTMGHGTGDELLKQVADRIRALLRESDAAARLGGDEFLILLEGLHRQEQAEIVVSKIIESFEHPFIIDSKKIYTSASIGISTYPDDGETVELLMQHADAAMYSAKNDSNINYRFFSQDLRAYIDEQLSVKEHLRHAIRNNELSIFYQPKIRLLDAQVVGAEALLRWHNIELGHVSPANFIPVAEKYGLIEEIGSWVLDKACKQASKWEDISPHPLQVAVNISPCQFRSREFLDVVENALEESGLPEELLELEITESLLMQDTAEPLDILNALKAKDVTLALDDFGTGYSSLSYLKRFPLQVLKIDRSFINDMMENKYNLSLVDAIVAMAKTLNLSLVAEGVETREQLAFLQRRNVDVVQGYYFSPPLPEDQFREYVEQSFALEKL